MTRTREPKPNLIDCPHCKPGLLPVKSVMYLTSRLYRRLQPVPMNREDCVSCCGTGKICAQCRQGRTSDPEEDGCECTRWRSGEENKPPAGD